MAWLTLHWGILPRIEQWRPQIQARASAALGVPVTIGAIRVRSQGWVPTLELADVVLHDRAQREALRLPSVHAAVSLPSLLLLELRFEQLHIEGAELEVRRDPLGRIHVAGIEMTSAAGDDEGKAADWLLAQHEFVIRRGKLRWIDELQLAPALELVDVDLVLRNGLRHHELRLDATPPAAWGERFSLQGRFTQSLLARAGDWRRWSGTLHANLPRADVAELRRYVKLPFELTQGDGALRAWLDLDRGQWRAATVDLALRAVSVRLASTVDALVLSQVQGRLAAERDERGIVLAAQRLAFVTGDGVAWPATDAKLALRQLQPADGSSQPVTGGEISADRLDLAVMARVASRLPLGTALHQLLTELAPAGQVRGLVGRWEGALDAPTGYQARAQVTALAIAAAPAADPQALGRPGLRNATIDFNASEQGGKASLAIDQGALLLPGMFEQSEVGFDQFATQLVWRIAPGKVAGAASAIELKFSNTRFANADMQGEMSGSWRTGDGPPAKTGSGRGARYPGLLDLTGKLTRGRAAAVARYLPLGIPQATRHYVQRAVVEGRVASATFKVKGDLWDFPFVGAAPGAAASGEFRVSARADDVTLAYVPGEVGDASAWPAFTRVSGELVFDRTSMEIRNAQARLWGVELTRVNGGIRNLVEQPVLRIEGQGRGPMADLLRYVNTTPVGGWTRSALHDAVASGNGELRLALELPLADLSRSVVQGGITLLGNDVRLRPDTPLLGAARARVEFSHKGFTVVGGSARVLGGDATFDGGTQADGSARFTAQGVASAESLRRASELGSLSRLAGFASGQAPYKLALGFVRGETEIALTSPLGGLVLDLPAPLKKSAEAALPLRFETKLLPEAAGTPTRDTLRIDLGTVLQASFVRDVSQDTPVVLRGAIGVQDTLPPMPERGVHALVNLPLLDTDQWQAALQRLQGPQGPPSTPGAPGADAADDSYLPRTVALRVQELLSGGRKLTRVVAGLTHDSSDATWRANLDAEQLGGYAEYRAARGANPGRVYARLARLSLPPAEADSVESLLEQAPPSVPALDIVIEDFELRGKKLGRIEIEAVNRLAEGSREWRLTRLSASTPEALLTASGQWQPAPGNPSRRRMVMDFKLDLLDSGAFAERLGLGKVLRNGKGRLQGQVSWAGSPLSLHLPSLDGRINLALETGQFLKAGPGAGRLLGVLSLQALPRRLVLDFRDLFQEGFAFDNVTGDVTVASGVAQTNNLRMRGVQAAVLMEGSADIARETQDLRVWVVPEINAGTASLAYAAINPAIGLGTFVAQLVLRRPLMAAGTREFTVQGAWADPKVERIERKPGAPLPDIDAPAQAPAASAPPGPP